MASTMWHWLPSPRRLLIFTHDVAVTGASFPIAMALRENFQLHAEHVAPILWGTLFVLILAGAIFAMFGLHRGMWRYASFDDIVSSARAQTILFLALMAVVCFTKVLQAVPRSVPVIFWFVAMVGVSMSRLIYRYYWQMRARTRKVGLDGDRHVLLAGPPDMLARIIHGWGWLSAPPFRIVGIVSEQFHPGRSLAGVPVVGELADVDQMLTDLEVRGQRPDRIVIAGSAIDAGPYQQLVLAARREGIAVDIGLAPLYECAGEEGAARIDDEQQIIALCAYHRIKRIIDIVLAGTGIIVLSPLYGLIALVSLASMGRPLLFDQVRPGRYCRSIAVLKFRTMRQPQIRDRRIMTDEERATSLGRLLRRYRVDELPQLWNVVLGHMSLIGPRPLLPRDLTEMDPLALRVRYSVRPGLTGWAQVNGGHQLDQAQKLALDLYYVWHASFLLDMKILFLTARMVLLGERTNKREIERAEAALGMLKHLEKA